MTTNATNNSNSFLQCLDPAGNFSWVRQIEGQTMDRIIAVSAHSTDVYCTGEFAGAASDFDIGPGVYTLSALDRDALILKISSCSLPPSPTISAASLNACDSSKFVLSANPTAGVSWRNNLMSNNYLGSGGTFTSSILGLGTYTFYAAQTNSCGESFPPAQIQVSVNPSPTINVVVGNTVYCSGAAVTLSANGANNYAVANQFFTSTVALTPLGDTVYTVTGSSASGYIASSTVLLVMDVCNAIKNIEAKKNAKLWPNPSYGQLSATMENLQKLEVYSVSGQLTLTVESEGNELHLIHSLSPGFYLARLTDAEGIVDERKLIIAE